MKKQKKNKKDVSSNQQQILEIKELNEKYGSLSESADGVVESFDEWPLSAATRAGLAKHGFSTPTDIQRRTVPAALHGRDIVAAARTGSGKTLAFIVPLLELLYRQQWSLDDGLAALVITPTRELAYQIFNVLNQVGQEHDFSAALIIGGKDLKFERKRIDQVNIVICTPGRLLQHMDENARFDTDSLQMLVLDEADRCLDLGFSAAMNAIIEHLPAHRQTMLFSATQTRSVSDLVRLSMTQPVFVSATETKSAPICDVTDDVAADVTSDVTPAQLAHSYVVCEQHDKLDLLWSFIKHHKHHKTLVFLQTCKQVKFVYESFSRLRPGVTLLALYGGLHQLRRMTVYDEFCRKQKSVLFATDVAARGLDFPEVNWVLQLDCPEDVNTYIHRAGRTARHERGGESLLVLTCSQQESMIKLLHQRGLSVEHIEVNSSKTSTIQRKLEAILARDVQLKESAKRALKAYCKSLLLMKNKQVFDIKSLDLEAFSRSLGLAIAPRVRFLDRQQKQQQQKQQHNKSCDEPINTDKFPSSPPDVASGAGLARSEFRSAYRFHDDAQCRDVTMTSSLGPGDVTMNDDDDEGDSGEKGEDGMAGGLLHVVSRARQLSPPGHTGGVTSDPPAAASVSRPSRAAVSKVALAKRALKKRVQSNTRVLYDAAGQEVTDRTKQQTSSLAREYHRSATKTQLSQLESNPDGSAVIDAATAGGIDIENVRRVLAAEDLIDRQIQRDKIRAKHREKKIKLKEQRRRHDEQNDDVPSDSGGEVSDASLHNDGADAANSSASENEQVEPGILTNKQQQSRKRKRPSRSHEMVLQQADADVELPSFSRLQDDEQLALHLLASQS